MNWRKYMGVLTGILVSVVFLALALYRVDVRAVSDALAAADYRLIALSAIFTLGSYIFRSARWARFLRPQKQIPTARLFPILVVGFALNNFLPGRPGEFARAFALGQREGLPKTLGLATVIVERVADGLVLIATLAIISLGFDLPGWGERVEGIWLAIFAAALGGLLLLLLQEERATRLLQRVIHWLPPQIARRAGKMFSSFILGLHSLRSPTDVIAIVLLSLAAWTCEAAHYFLVLTGFGLLNNPSARGYAAAFTMVIVNLGISIPAAPGGVGPFEAAGVLALGAFQLSRERALPAVLAAHAVQFLLISSLGMLFTAREGLSFTRAVEQAE